MADAGVGVLPGAGLSIVGGFAQQWFNVAHQSRRERGGRGVVKGVLDGHMPTVRRCGRIGLSNRLLRSCCRWAASETACHHLVDL